MNRKIEEKIADEINERIQELGFEVEYVEYVKEGSQNILRVVLDKKEGNVTIDDCELVSRDIEEKVDSFMKSEYVLEVSSPGVERQLKNLSLYHKYIGNEIYVKLFQKDEDGKEFTGKLISVEGEKSIVIELANGEKSILLDNIASAHTVYDFNRVLKENADNVNLNKLNKFNKK